MATKDKYDRQLRLWGSHGQELLVNSRILLLNAGPTGTETLKNLVLPGCGYVAIVDGGLVTNESLQNNFFVAKEYLGQPIAKVCVQMPTAVPADSLPFFTAWHLPHFFPLSSCSFSGFP